jgi:plastocyanin
MKRNRHFTGKNSWALLLVSVLLILPSGCTKSSTADSGPGTNEVWIQNMSYNPGTITVVAGTTIIWTNKDAVNHTVTSNSGAFDSGSLANGATYSHQFATAGTFAYHCTFHSGMNATVVVN